MKIRSYAVVVIVLSIVVWQRDVRNSPFWNDPREGMVSESVSAEDRSYSTDQRLSFARAQRYGRLPLSFEPNQGQAGEGVKFLSRGSGYDLALTSGEAVLVLGPPINAKNNEAPRAGQETPESASSQSDPSLLRMRLVGSNPAPTLAGIEELPGKNNYLIGNDPAKWRTNVPTYARVRYEDVYPGIDLDFYGNQRQLEYDFVVAPGASPDVIELDFDGADSIELNVEGDLIPHTPGGDVKQHKPVVYQVVDGLRKSIAAGYVVNDHSVLFQVAAYDANEILIIDPILTYSTYWGGFAQGRGIAVDSDGNVYISGDTASSNLTTTTGSLQPSFGGGLDAFVTKFNADGSAVVYSTFIGGSGDDGSGGIAVDASGSVYLAGETFSADFPVTAGVAQTTISAGEDGFVARLNASGSALVYSTYLGGAEEEQVSAVAVDSTGNAYVTGRTRSEDFPTTPGAFQTSDPRPSFPDGPSYAAFITKLNPDGSALVYSTYLGGAVTEEGSGIAIDSSGNAYITGETRSENFPTTAGAAQTSFGSFDSGDQDAFVTKLNPDGSALVYSTYLGGSSEDGAAAIAVDDSGNAYVVGGTRSMDFPVTEGAFDTTTAEDTGGNCPELPVPCGEAFVTKINPTGSALVYSTYFHGDEVFFSSEAATGLAVSSSGEVYFTGSTDALDFPLVNPLQAENAQPFSSSDMFVAQLNSSGSALLFSTYFGGVGDDLGTDIALDASGNVYVVGWTAASDFPTRNALQTTFDGIFGGVLLKITKDGSTSTFSVPDRGATSTASPGTLGTTTVGYARIRPDDGVTTPAGVAIFGFTQNGVLVTEAGVPAAAPVEEGRIFAEVNGPIGTGLAIANPNDIPATISFYFTDAAGTDFGSGSLTLGANEHISKFLNEAPFNSGQSVLGTFTFASSVPVAAIALRTFVNERGEFLITTLPVAPLAPESADTIYFPQYADGGGFTTQVVLVNPTNATISGTVQFWGQGSGETPAEPVSLALDTGSTGSEFSYAIPPRSSKRLRTANPAGATSVGSVRVTSTGGTASPSGVAIFSFKPGEFTVSEAGVAALPVGTAFRLYVESLGTPGQAGSVRSGLAITDTSSSSNTITLELTSLDGTTVGEAQVLSLPPSGHTSKFLDELFSLSDGFSGVLRITSSSEIAMVGLRGRTNERSDFLLTTTPPSNEADASTSSDLFFPQIADSGGWTTQFVVFSGTTGQTSAGTLQFLDQSGDALDLSGQSWTELNPGPDPVAGLPELASHTAGVFDRATNQLIVFGGVGPAGSPPFGLSNEVWRLTGANGLGGTPSWIKVTPDGPSPTPRKWPEGGYDAASNRMIMFGGALGGSSPRTNEVLVLDNANGLGANPTWVPLVPSGSGPDARFWHSAIYDPGRNRLIVYGGSNCFTAASFNDVWVLENANGSGQTTPTWIQLSPSGVVPAIHRDTHEAVYDPGTRRMIVFGGRNSDSTSHNDVWVLTNANGVGGSPAWIQLSPAAPLPTPRNVVSGVYDPATNRLTIFGGGGDSGITNELWVLSNANGTEATSPAWTPLNPAGALPAARAFATGVYDSANNRLTIFRGSDLTQSFNDVWVLTDANGSLGF